jgi:transcriptional regulator with XRE-family HTH domain
VYNIVMARPPRKGNEDNPLRKLREALGTDGLPLPQHKLAELLGVSPETVKSIEAGRRGITEKLDEWIAIHLGAWWFEKARYWVSIGTLEPLNPENSRGWRKATFDRELETHALMLRLMLVLEYAPEKRFREIADTVEMKLQEILQEFDYSPDAHDPPDRHDPDWISTELRLVPDDRGSYRRHRKGSLSDFRRRMGIPESPDRKAKK